MNLAWYKIENYVLNFQIEIYYASISHDYLKIKWLQKQFIHTIQGKLIASRCALLYTKQREGSPFLRRGDEVVSLSLAFHLFLKNKKKKVFWKSWNSKGVTKTKFLWMFWNTLRVPFSDQIRSARSVLVQRRHKKVVFVDGLDQRRSSLCSKPLCLSFFLCKTQTNPPKDTKKKKGRLNSKTAELNFLKNNKLTKWWILFFLQKNKKTRIRIFDSYLSSKKNIFIKKKNFFLIKERAKHILVKLALEAEWEARFSQNSLSLRTGRNVFDGLSTFFKNFDNSSCFVIDSYISHNLTVSVQSKLFNDVWFRKIDTFLRLKTEMNVWLKKKKILFHKQSIKGPEAR